MKFQPLWRRFERGFLWVTLGACCFVASAPLRERVVAWQNQSALESQWQTALRRAAASPPSTPKRASGRLMALGSKRFLAKERAPLWPLARLSCAKIRLNAIVVEGTSDAQLRRGPGHETKSSFPGGANCVIAAHRNAFGWWFYRLNELSSGDIVVLRVPGRKLVYRVAAKRTVSVRDISILKARPKTAPRLTLYTCTLPKTPRRLVVIANLQSSSPG